MNKVNLYLNDKTNIDLLLFQTSPKSNINISTIHNSKGLTYDHVFFDLSIFDRNSPHFTQLIYVGLTRAKYQTYSFFHNELTHSNLLFLNPEKLRDNQNNHLNYIDYKFFQLQNQEDQQTYINRQELLLKLNQNSFLTIKYGRYLNRNSYYLYLNSSAIPIAKLNNRFVNIIKEQTEITDNTKYKFSNITIIDKYCEIIDDKLVAMIEFGGFIDYEKSL